MDIARVCDLPFDVSELPPDLTRPLPPRRRVLLACEILAAYCRVRLRLFRDHFPTALRGVRDLSGVSDLSQLDAARSRPDAMAPVEAGERARKERQTHEVRVTYLRAARLARAVQRTLKFVPADARCLMQSRVLTALLARRDIDTKLLIGVSQGDEFQAHAWVEYAGYALLPDSQGIYHVLAEL